MFYRYYTSHRALERLSLFAADQYRLQVGYQYYKDGEVILPKPIPHYREFIFPEISSDRFSRFKFKEKGKENEELPDIFNTSEHTIVSARAREVIEENDECKHQFVPAIFINYFGDPIPKGEYFNLWVKRRLSIEEIGIKPKVNFLADAERFLGTIQHNEELRRRVEQVPLWQTPVGLSALYLSEELFQTLKSEKITGIEELGKFSEETEETVGYV